MKYFALVTLGSSPGSGIAVEKEEILSTFYRKTKHSLNGFKSIRFVSEKLKQGKSKPLNISTFSGTYHWIRV